MVYTRQDIKNDIINSVTGHCGVFLLHVVYKVGYYQNFQGCPLKNILCVFNSLLSVDEECCADLVPGVASVVAAHGHPVVAQHEEHAVGRHRHGNVPDHLVHLPG